jgi:cytochrome c-type biogenesis protein CcmE
VNRARRSKVLLGSLLVAGSMGYLLWTASRSNLVYYYEIGEARAAVRPDQHVRLSGDVVEGSVRRTPGTARMTFEIEDPAGVHRVPVAYEGTVPDIFRPGIQVVVEGRFDASGGFAADRLTAKCPSKYQAAGDLDRPQTGAPPATGPAAGTPPAGRTDPADRPAAGA